MQKKYSDKFLKFNKNFANNFLLISGSVLKNFRTYVYLFFIPICFMAVFSWFTGGSDSNFRPPQLFLFMMIPTYAIVFLVNISISEWKNSVFLKRIHSAGISKIEFLASIWIFNFIAGFIAFLFGLLTIYILGFFYVKPAEESISTMLGLISFSEWLGILYAISLNIIISISIGTIISGLVRSVSLSQSISIIVIMACIVFSDNLLSISLMSVNEGLVIFSYFFPQKHTVWIGLISASSGQVGWVVENPDRLVISFDFNLLLVSFTGLFYTMILIIAAYFSFGWNNKK
ncbi:hypothetical protein [Spiroplasma monobiae]|uniref:ABC transporter ATP-binding protein n=1 Tax=Spiroplasma monobiae MQ-1 TaxID=1336748 RepID=A0A2K9LUD1_SPISQ|nr:hypothetical protein [Spiroplasma monobiae]AUM62656.1 ABC transporter ATP-binding protein [Spiroplasma monobiae MQ-1]